MSTPKGASEPLDSNYGHYTAQSYAQQEYEPPYVSPQGFDDNFADAVAERVVQRLRQEPLGNANPRPSAPDKNVLRLITAVIFTFMFLPFAFFFLIMIGGTAGLVGFCIAGFTIFVTVLVLLDKIK